MRHRTLEKGGATYGEKTLLKEICFGSGGGSVGIYFGGSGGGIIELIIQQQLINYGSIQSNGGDGSISGGGGSGGSISIELQYQCKNPHIYYRPPHQFHQNKLEQNFGTIKCIGGNQNRMNKGGKGRITIYGIELSSNDIKNIDPKPFNSRHK
ncbi:hypothetical protein RFI_31980 [Reticulomyxa filosa]|uniref:Uncharacterized protein n=1 Tax=Reticulomyxa filosa TaxID=46433 RepID=X6LVP6_RETFI|nr:hypothetical protein RFI_31980 [Reticulomyxa filosa]|eukprot:ETO05416.1 hypothetical protein RFI_31980 [Reticulomyxa filosa]